jgi:hypothetical protein
MAVAGDLGLPFLQKVIGLLQDCGAVGLERCQSYLNIFFLRCQVLDVLLVEFY